MSSKILLRRGTAAQWSSANPILGIGELGIETDTLKIKIGNGTSTWTQLTSYANVTPSQLTSEINNLINAAPATLDTLNELAAAINNDASFSTTVNNLLTGKVSKSGGDTITASTASTKGLIIKAAASQSVNLLEFQNSIGNSITYFNSNGGLTATEGVISTLYSGGYLTTGTLGYYNATTFAPSVIPIVVRGAASQTADLQQWQNSSGTVLAKVTSSGTISQGSGTNYTLLDSAYGQVSIRAGGSLSGSLTVGTGVASITAIIVKAASSQTADLQQWQNSSGTVLSKVLASGQFVAVGDNLNNFQSIGASSTLYNGFSVTTNTNAASYVMGTAGASETTFGVANSFYIYDGIAGAMRFKIMPTGLVGINSFSPAAQLQVNSSSASTAALIVKGAASQTADLQQWQNSAGEVQVSIKPTASLTNVLKFTEQYSFAINWGNMPILSTASGELVISPYGPERAALIVKGLASQTDNLQEWQNSSGTNLAYMSTNGHLIAQRVYAPDSLYVVASGGPGTVNIETYATHGIGVIIKGKASQTADLQQWQNSSSTTLLRINSAGQIQAPQPASVGLVVKAAANLTATVTNAVGNGTTVTYTAANTFTAGQTVTITGIDPVAYNLSSVTIATATTTTFTVTNAATGTYVSGGTATTAQSGNLLDFQDAGGVSRSRFGPTGSLVISNVASGDMAVFIGSSGNTQIVAAGGIRQNANVGNSFGAGIPAGVTVNIGTFTAANIGLVVNGAASQTGDLQQWKNSSGTVLSKISSNGSATFDSYNPSSIGTALLLTNTGTGVNTEAKIQFGLGGANHGYISSVYLATPSSGGALKFATSNSTGTEIERMRIDNQGTVTVNGFVAGAQGLIVKGAASQTANLQEWQNSAGTVMGRIDGQYGTIRSISGIDLTNTHTGSPTITARVNYANTTPIVIVGAASQTANLQEWSNNSGTVLAKITASGALDATAITVNGAAISTGSASGLSDAFMLMGA